MAGHLEHYTESPKTLAERYSARIQKDSSDADAYHHRAHALARLGRFQEAIQDLTQAIRRRPDDPHLRYFRGAIYGEGLKQYESAISDLEAALARKPDYPSDRDLLAECCNNRAWELTTGPEPRRALDHALGWAERAVELTSGQGIFLNTLGVVQYRLGRYAEAMATLERSLAAGRGQTDAFDLFFLAMAHQMMGHRDQARDCYDRAVRWMENPKSLAAQYAQELAAFRAEAKVILTDLPDDVFAGPE